MNTSTLQQLKMAWLVAKETGDTETQIRLLRDHPEEQAALTDFIAAYYANSGVVSGDDDAELSLLTQRACQTALECVFAPSPAFANLAELRKSRGMSKINVAHSLRLSVDVWSKFESGAIELVSLSQRQLERLAHFFRISIDQFSTLLNNSQPAMTINRRQSSEAARKQQGPQQQTFAEAIARSTMSKEDKHFWLEE